MKSVLQKCFVKHLPVMLCTAILSVYNVQAQTCPPPVTSTITTYSSTYYPGQQATVSTGSTSVIIGAATAPLPELKTFRKMMASKAVAFISREKVAT